MFLFQEISKLLRATEGWEVGNKEEIRLTKLATWDWQMLLWGWQQLLLQDKNLNLETDKCFCKPNQMQICAPATRRKWAVREASDNVGRKKILFAIKLPTTTDWLHSYKLAQNKLVDFMSIGSTTHLLPNSTFVLISPVWLQYKTRKRMQQLFYLSLMLKIILLASLA